MPFVYLNGRYIMDKSFQNKQYCYIRLRRLHLIVTLMDSDKKEFSVRLKVGENN